MLRVLKATVTMKFLDHPENEMELPFKKQQEHTHDIQISWKSCNDCGQLFEHYCFSSARGKGRNIYGLPKPKIRHLVT